MKRGRPLGSGATLGVPPCTFHTNSRVVLNGRYGGDRPRQRFRCYPSDGDKPHNFSGTLARSVLEPTAECETCESPLQRHQGPRHSRRYDFPVHEVALALQRVGNLMSYTEAAIRARQETGLSWRVNRTLVANWVEVFAPVVAARHAEDSWPETVVLDSTPFQAMTASGPREVFNVFVAYGYEQGRRRGRAVQIVVSTRRNAQAWHGVLSAKKGQPTLLVSYPARCKRSLRFAHRP